MGGVVKDTYSRQQKREKASQSVLYQRRKKRESARTGALRGAGVPRCPPTSARALPGQKNFREKKKTVNYRLN